MAVKYETNRWGDKVATSTDGPSGIVSKAPVKDKPAEPRPAWMQDILDGMDAFDPFKEKA